MGSAEDHSQLRDALTERARELGLSSIGIASPAPSRHGSVVERWVAEGYHGAMAWFDGPGSMARRLDLSLTLPEVRSVIVAAEPYDQPDPPGIPDDPSLGVIARYARGRDYHKVLLRKLEALGRWLEESAEPNTGKADTASGDSGPTKGEGVRWRAYIDTGPILERELAERAGLGWFGKNTLLIHPRRGSYFFLGVLLTDLELAPALDAERIDDHCGSCRACLDACPTGALLGRDEDGAPIMDATRCISYLTIEHPGPIPEELRPAIGNRIYGCDICQEVCPWNRKFSEPAEEPGYAARGPGERPVGVERLPREGVSAGTHPGTQAPPLVELMGMTRDDWNAFSRGSAIRRAGYEGFRRNVAVAIGNWLVGVEGEPPEEAVAALREAVEDESQLVREHAAWALGWAGTF